MQNSKEPNMDPLVEVLEDPEDAFWEETLQYVTFKVKEEEYGVDIKKVREIKGWMDVTRIPGAPSWVKGVVNLRGEIAPIIDMRQKFDMGYLEPQKNNVVVIVAIEERTLGLLVDVVSDIVNLPRHMMQNIPGVERNSDAAYLSGMAVLRGRLISLLDLSKIGEDLGRSGGFN